jgi:protein-disulfide isomerase
MEAAEAAECADNQGKFWEYADGLFEDQRELGTEDSVEAFLVALGGRVGLDQSRFRACLSSQQFDNRIRSQIADGNLQRIDATPTFFVNGRRQVGSVPYQQLEQLVESRRK